LVGWACARPPRPRRCKELRQRDTALRRRAGRRTRIAPIQAPPSGNAPAAILLGEADLILAVGAAVAEELYGRRVPVLQLTLDDLATLPDGAAVAVEEGGVVTLL